GTLAAGGKRPMRRDTIFRIASMTKPVTAVATMILVEECKVRLDEPVDRLVPELGGRQVLRRLDGPIHEVEPARRPIMVRDLLTFRMGFGVVFDLPASAPIQQAIDERLRVPVGSAHPHTTVGLDEWAGRLGTLPLMHQPGEGWIYNTGSHVLGLLIERASGQPLETFFRERVFEPLGMKDTGFSVPAKKVGRLPVGYAPHPATGTFEVTDGDRDSLWTRPPVFPDGAAGLVSTVDDYLAFARMLLEGGRLRKGRLLSRPAVEAMRTDQLPPEVKAVARFVPGYWESHGWGFGMAVVTKREGVAASPGQFGWDGGYGTSWASDPREDLTAILMTQVQGYPPLSAVYQDFWTSVYAAIDD
ncbi:MAG: beta-lactamase family protein, partial [bacterium]|nr:beta-lactamase family protein [bacterium]